VLQGLTSFRTYGKGKYARCSCFVAFRSVGVAGAAF
jgi:hypothetical protein